MGGTVGMLGLVTSFLCDMAVAVAVVVAVPVAVVVAVATADASFTLLYKN